MRILHYSLGFPPYRSGGLTKFCIDLMVQQAKEGSCVALLWPGQMKFLNKETTIKKHSDVEVEGYNIQNFEIINPLPISYDEGIADVHSFIFDSGKKSYEKLLEDFQPDIIHMHTLMGIHKSFLKVAKDKGIRLVFTAHDFFPICPKVTMFCNGTICTSAQSCKKCGVCNATALDIKKIQILQSPIYRKLKDTFWVKRLRKKHRDGYLDQSTLNENVNSVGTPKDYKILREYYYSLLKMMDMIHYNSSVTKKVYESFFSLPQNQIISITHSDIKDNRRKKFFPDNMLRIRYLGPNGEAKGFFLLKEALDKLWNVQQSFCLDIHFIPTEISPYINIHERYTYKDLKNIFEETDVLIAPSLLYETFGFTVLEALSYGVPVIISGTVGARDILEVGTGVVIENITSEKLCFTLQNLKVQNLRDMNKKILQKQHIVKIDDVSKQIQKKCYG